MTGEPLSSGGVWPASKGLLLGVLAPALTLIALGTLAWSMALPVVTLHKLASRPSSYTVPTGIWDLIQTGNVLLGLIVFAFSVAFPFVKLAALLALRFGHADGERRQRSLTWLGILGKWSMLDVFVIAILIASIRLGILSEAEAEPGIYVFGGAILLSMLATILVSVAGLPSREVTAEARARLAGRSARSWWVALALATFLAGVNLPLMRLEKWHFWENDFSLVTAIGSMAREGELVLAVVLLLFVIVLPLVHLIALFLLRSRREPSPGLVRLVRLVEKWAMLDVFALALTVVLVKVSDMARVEPRLGLWLVLASALLTQLEIRALRRDLR